MAVFLPVFTKPSEAPVWVGGKGVWRFWWVQVHLTDCSISS